MSEESLAKRLLLLGILLSFQSVLPVSIQPKESEGPLVLIIGSGISGIGAAEKLYQHGFHNVRILEATRRTGGRIWTQSFAKGLVEVGAQWIHGPSSKNPIFRLAAQYGLLNPDALLEENQNMDMNDFLLNLTFSVFYSSSGKKINLELVSDANNMYYESLKKAENFTEDDCNPDASVGGFLKKEIVRRSQDWDKEMSELNLALLQGLLNHESVVTGSHSMDHVALCPFGEYTTLPGLDCTFPKGFESLVDHLKANLPNDTVMLNKAVKRINWNGSFQNQDSHVYPVEVQCEDGDTFVADHVIVTVPLGFLKKRAEDFLSPPLPANKIQAIQKLGFGTVNKIILELEEPFWEPNTSYIHLVWEGDSPLKEPENNYNKNWMKKLVGFTVLEPPGQLGHVLVGFIAGKESEYMETLTDEELLTAMTALLRQFTGNADLPPPISCMRSKWHSQPYTFGSYSYKAVGSSGQDSDILAEPLTSDKEASKIPQVLFAGEATERKFYSTTHGALMSGWKQAQRLIDLYPHLKAAKSNGKL